MWLGIVFCERACASDADAEREASREQVTAPPIVWKRIIPELEQIRRLEDQHDSLPRFSLFGTDRGNNREKIDRILAEAAEILEISEASNLRAEILVLEEENSASKERIADLKEKRISAPNNAIFGESVAKIDDQIDRMMEAVIERESEIEDKRRVFANQVRSMGLDLSRDQIDFLLSTVVGDEVIDLAIAFYNIKLITRDLERLMSESLEDIEIARRYYGMYTVLLQSMDALYETSLQSINDRYLIEISGIVARTQALMTQTDQLIRRAEQKHRSALQGNIRAQEFTLQAANMYQEYLEQQRSGIQEARRKLKKNLDVAGNTYETVKISGDLLQVMRTSGELFELLFDLHVPELRPFENIEMRREFEKLTTRLRWSGR